MSLVNALYDFVLTMGISAITWQEIVMILISFVLIYLALVKGFEPLLLLPIAFGMLLANLPLAGLNAEPVYEIITNPVTGEHTHKMVDAGGLLYWLYRGVKLGIYPPLIFLRSSTVITGILWILAKCII